MQERTRIRKQARKRAQVRKCDRASPDFHLKHPTTALSFAFTGGNRHKMRMASIHYWIILLLIFRVGNCSLSSHTRKHGMSPSALYVKEDPPRRLLIFGNGNVRL